MAAEAVGIELDPRQCKVRFTNEAGTRNSLRTRTPAIPHLVALFCSHLSIRDLVSSESRLREDAQAQLEGALWRGGARPRH